MKTLFILLSILLLTACSNEEGSSSEAKNKHILSDQKQALDKAKNVEQLIQDGFNGKSKAIDEQTK